MNLKQRSKLFALAAMAFLCLALVSCKRDNESKDYDVLTLNGEEYAVFGYSNRLIVIDPSSFYWHPSEQSGALVIDCCSLPAAKKGLQDQDYPCEVDISFDGLQDLKKGIKLEDFSPVLGDYFAHEHFGYAQWSEVPYRSGSATVTALKKDSYISIRFESFTFRDREKSYTLDGTVKLVFEEN